MMIWRKYDCSTGLTKRISQSSTIFGESHAQRDIQHDAPQELEAHPSFALVGTNLRCTMPSTDVCSFALTIVACEEDA